MVTLVALSVRSDNRGPFLDPNGVVYLNSVASRAYEAMNIEFKAHFGYALIPVEGLRSPQRQNYLYQGFEHHLPGFSLAAPPHESNHEIEHGAKACDFGSGVATISSPQHAWMVTNGPRWGWIWTGGNFNPKEGWHFEQNGLAVASAATTIDLPKEEDMADTKLFECVEDHAGNAADPVPTANGAYAIFGFGYYFPVANPDQLAQIKRMYPSLLLPDGTVDQINAHQWNVAYKLATT